MQLSSGLASLTVYLDGKPGLDHELDTNPMFIRKTAQLLGAILDGLEGFLSAGCGHLEIIAQAGLICYPSDNIRVSGHATLRESYLQRDVLLTRPVKRT